MLIFYGYQRPFHRDKAAEALIYQLNPPPPRSTPVMPTLKLNAFLLPLAHVIS